MAIAFDTIPGNLRVPLFYAELSAGGTPFASSERLLLIGQKLPAGAAVAEEPILVPSSSQAEDALFGQGSMLSQMIRIARRNAPFQEIWALPFDDAGGAAAATGAVDYTTLTLPVAIAQTVSLYVAGRRYAVTATPASTAATIATAMAAEINADADAPVTATDAAGVVTITARHAGDLGNGIDIRTTLIGGETIISGEATVTAMAGGATDPTITAGLANLADEDFLWLASPYADATNTTALTDLLNNQSGRWSPYQQLYGHAVTAKIDTVANLSTLGSGLNDPHLTVMGSNGMPSPVWELTAALGAKVAQHLSDAPELSRPLHYIELEGIVAPKVSDRFGISDKNVLLYDGIATHGVSRAGAVTIERAITTYKTNAAGGADATFLDIQTMAQSQYILRYLRTKVLSRHARQGLAGDDTPAINGVARPKDIRATLIAGYAELTNLGVVENQRAFEDALIVERNAVDYNRVDVSLPFDVVNQLRVLAVQATANLQF
ncbi:phage tail sheath subtilisin-like domain-containing protein [Sulfitobacter sp. 1A15106]|uniref:phage tail sheath subtilisin-like domain-containing protein n=1 Tax=Sulfitobacter sp. 1A15106 TaxID=3368590 RepID=UPI003745A863